jgi:acetylornithine deacetylase/succinyl-diaminopimelate desuccinylase-like protein
MIAPDVPSITSGLRGLCYWEVEVTGANHDLHSGIYGGAVANPINILCKMIAGLHDENNHITIPGFYDDVLVISDEERALMAQAPFNEEDYKRDLGIKAVHGEKGYSTKERTGIRPCLDICGIWGGHTGEGSKTVLPSKAYAKISTRLVANQDFEKISKLFQEYFESVAPDYVTVKVTPCHGGAAYVSPLELKAYKSAWLYYHMEDYLAAHYALKNVLKDNADNRYREDILYYTAMAAYKYALNSVPSKQRERYLVFVDDYFNIVSEFPESKYLKELEGLYNKAQKQLKKDNENG